jgi:hypothetical protein
MVRTIVAESWAHLCEVLFEDAWQPEIRRHRSHYAYKGLNREDYRLTTSLMRLGGSFPQVERHLVRNFKKYAHRDAAPGDSLWNWLAVAQHHGLPTRLLDWTYSPFVALHFATDKMELYDLDAVVWCANFVRAHEGLPQDMREILGREGSDVWTTELLDERLPTWESLEALDSVLMFFEPPSLDQRILSQYALFSVLSDAETAVDDWLERRAELAKRVVVPAGLKQEVRDKLDQANINERILFPGLDGLSRWLRRHYAPGLPPER